MEKDTPIFFGIKEIKETGFSVDESIEFNPSSKSHCQYHVNLESRAADETVTFTIETTFKEIEGSRPFMSGKSFTKFTIQNMKQYAGFKEDGTEAVTLPLPLWTTLFSLSYSHARALLARSAAGTKFSIVMLPVINPEEAFKTIFAKEFANESNKKAPTF